jgi:FkbM family methyltransferase
VLTTLRYILRHPLNRGTPFAALLRYLRWQIGSRLVPGPVVIDFIGVRLIARRGGNATGHVYSGLHWFSEMGFCFHLLRPGDVFVDVGANIGTYSLPAAARGATVIAFEPGPEAFAELTANIRLNSLPIDARNQAVGAEAGVLPFSIGQDTVNHAALPGEPFREVPVVVLDEAVDTAFLVKIDVEGFEGAVMAGGPRVLQSATAVIMELGGGGALYGYDEDAIRAQMVRWGFEAVGYDPLRRTLTAPVPGEDAMFVRDRERVVERLRTATPLPVLGRAL